MKYEITDAQQRDINAWVKEVMADFLKKQKAYTFKSRRMREALAIDAVHGLRIEYCFSHSSGIGITLIVRVSAVGCRNVHKDFTDYETW